MQSLFFKILLGFCIVVVLVGFSLETSSILANYYEVRWQMVLHSIMPMEAEKCAHLYEQSGKQAVEDYLDDLQRHKSLFAFISLMKMETRSLIAARPKCS